VEVRILVDGGNAAAGVYGPLYDPDTMTIDSSLLSQAPSAHRARTAGYFERCTAAEFSGWAVENGRSATVEVFVNDECVATVRCDQPRPDVVEAGPHENAGFFYRPSVPRRLPPAATVSVRLQDGIELTGSPRRVSRYEGYLEQGSHSMVAGWAAWDGRPAELSIHVDGLPVAQIRCGVARPDVAEERGLPEETGFSYVLPAPLAETGTVSVHFPDGTVLGEWRAMPGLDHLSPEVYDKALALHRERIGPPLDAIEAELRTADDRPSGLHEPMQLRVARDILASGLFDATFYLRDNPDVCAAGIDPLQHYVQYGDLEGRRPNPVFCPAEYRCLNETLPADLNTLAHYVRQGERHGWKASLTFDPQAYLAANEPIATFVGRPLFHFLTIGRAAGLAVRNFHGAGANRPRPARRVPRIAAQLSVKDEAEIVEHSIAHLRSIGVDHIIAVDIGSTDGTLEILEKYQADDFQLIRLSDRAVSAEATAQDALALQSFKSAPADWVIILDADEFWIPASGTLKECEALDHLDVLSVQRYNVPLGPDGPLMPDSLVPEQYDNLLLITEVLPEIRKRCILNPDMPWILVAEEPKPMMRPTKVFGLTAGDHDVLAGGAKLRRAKASDVFIAHVPLSTKRRFEKKVANIVALFARDGVDLFAGPEAWQNDPNAWHWRRWAALAREGRIAEELLRNTFDQMRIASMRKRRAIRTAAELLAGGIVVPPRT
jgi:glycosyltransferase involved in cell wall biosynthesis